MQAVLLVRRFVTGVSELAWDDVDISAAFHRLRFGRLFVFTD